MPVAVLKQDVDDFEAQRRPPKEYNDLRLGWLERRRILQRSGAKEDEIRQAFESAQKVRKQRQRTSSAWRLQLAKAEEVQQRICHSLAKKFHPKQFTKLKTKY
jgi:hypothetical protein